MFDYLNKNIALGYPDQVLHEAAMKDSTAPPGCPTPLRPRMAVQEEELGCATAQRLYKLRCECGRSWFELELPKLVQCPACFRLNLVSI
jgi:hypothetical protein